MVVHETRRRYRRLRSEGGPASSLGNKTRQELRTSKCPFGAPLFVIPQRYDDLVEELVHLILGITPQRHFELLSLHLRRGQVAFPARFPRPERLDDSLKELVHLVFGVAP